MLLECRNANSTACRPSEETDCVAEYGLPSRGEISRYRRPCCTVMRMLLYSETSRLAVWKSCSFQRVRSAPMPRDPCMDERNRYSSEVLRWLTQLGESVTHAIMTPGEYA